MGKRLFGTFGWGLLGLIGSIIIFLIAAAVTQSMVPVKLPTLSISTSAWSDYAFARGTWTMDNEKPAFPLQTTDIRCYRHDMTCTSAHAEIAFGDTLNAELTNYDVTRWDDEVITFKSTSATCADYTYTINRMNERVIGTRTTKGTEETCRNTSKQPIHLTLTDGFKVWSRLYDGARTKVDPFMWMALAGWWTFAGRVA